MILQECNFFQVTLDDYPNDQISREKSCALICQL